MVKEGEDFGVQPLGDLGGGGIAIGRDRAGDGVVGHLGSAVGQFLDEEVAVSVSLLAPVEEQGLRKRRGLKRLLRQRG